MVLRPPFLGDVLRQPRDIHTLGPCENGVVLGRKSRNLSFNPDPLSEMLCETLMSTLCQFCGSQVGGEEKEEAEEAENGWYPVSQESTGVASPSPVTSQACILIQRKETLTDTSLSWALSLPLVWQHKRSVEKCSFSTFTSN